ncbi:ABC transporter permease [Nocardioides limicola]|uniref:ABC transporter permease n=1 Tax=Nocardioides limicola TaxID=2803368 RepID=UPI00193C226C|nr:ABC transporter permease [Nocardioides sp. DJM-14]
MSSDSPTLSQLEAQRRLFDYWAIVYQRTWKGSVITSFLAPLLYVLALGVILGGFIEADPATLEGASSYLAFVVPGLIAAHAMQIAVFETTYPVMGMIKWHRVYESMLATPLRIVDLITSTLLFVLFRLVTTCAVFMLALAPFGVFATWWGALLAFVAQVLVGMAFGALVLAITAGLQNEQGFAVIFRLGMVPLMLFSGAFFPVSNLGPVMEWVARLTPLWHGVNLSRMFALDTVDWALVALHVVVLAALTVLGWACAVRRLTRRLEK